MYDTKETSLAQTNELQTTELQAQHNHATKKKFFKNIQIQHRRNCKQYA